MSTKELATGVHLSLKDNIQPIENPLEKMDKIGGYTFVWNNKQSTYQGKDVGVVAQEIQEVLPEIVSDTPGHLVTAQDQYWENCHTDSMSTWFYHGT